MSAHDRPLLWRERLTVRHAVQRGERLGDARLARAAVAHADRYLASPLSAHLRLGLLLSAGGLVVLAVLSALTRLEFRAGGAVGLVVGFVGGQVLLLRPLTVPRVRAARERNARVGTARRRGTRRR